MLGGGEVLAPAGTYLTGAIALRSDTILRLNKDAAITGSPDFEDYPVVDDVAWQAFAVKGKLALVGCRFTDKPHDQTFHEDYASASQGSG